MRYHTSALIAFAVFLEGKRYGFNSGSIALGNYENSKQFICSPSVDISINDNIDGYRQRSRRYNNLVFTANSDNHLLKSYDFRLSPGSILSANPQGNITVSGSGRMSINRYGNYNESNIALALSMPSGAFSGTYSNWHDESSEFSGYFNGTSTVVINANGYALRKGKARELDKNQRRTHWTFTVALGSLNPAI